MAKKKIVKEVKVDEVNEDQHDQNVSGIAMKPSNKMEAMTAAVNLLGMLPQDMAINCFDAMIQLIGQEAQNIPDGNAAHNAGTIVMKPSAASASMKESVKEAISEIFGNDESLSEEFKTKCTTLFESALSARLALEREEMRSLLEQEAEEKVESSLSLLVEQLDQYMDYLADEWMKDNEVAIESALRTEIAEELIFDIKEAFDKNNVTIPDEKVDALEALGRKVEELQAKYDDAVNENIELTNALTGYGKQEVLDDVAEGLTLSQKQKLGQLVEDIDFDDADSYANKVKVVKDRYFSGKAPAKSTGVLQEDVTDPPDEKKTHPEMARYLATMNNLNK